MRLFAQALEKKGITVWFDQFDLVPGDVTREAIESGLRNSDVIVSIFDKAATPSVSLFFELGAAIGMGKKIVPILPKGLDLDSVPLEVRLRSYLVRDTPDHTAEEWSTTLQAA